MSAPVIAVLNLKGGVGKTTVTASIGRGLFDEKQRGVLLLDLDPQFNLTQALQSQEDYKRYLDSGRTILTAFEPAPSTDLFRIRTTAEPPPPARSLARTLWHYRANPERHTLSLVMGNFDLMKYSLLANDALLQVARKRFLDFVSASRSEHDVILVDCNPSSSFLTRCALDVSSDVLIPVRPDKFSMLGIERLSRFIQRLGMARPPKLHILLNATSRTTFSETEQLIRESDFSADTLRAELFHSTLLSARPGFHQFPVDRKVAYSRTLRDDISAICKELAKRIGLQ